MGIGKLCSGVLNHFIKLQLSPGLERVCLGRGAGGSDVRPHAAHRGI
jgi:hypothetical protein